MCWLAIKSFLNSNFLQSLLTTIAVIFAYLIGKKQNEISEDLKEMQDVVELFVSPGVKELKRFNPKSGQFDTFGSKSVIIVQNVGTHLIYIQNYIFNGRTYELNGHVLPPTSAQAQGAIYQIELPENEDNHVSLDIRFSDIAKRKWKTVATADLIDGTWKVANHHRQLL